MALLGFIVTVLIACFLTLVGVAAATWPSGQRGVDGEKVFFVGLMIAAWIFVWWVCPFKVVAA